MHGPWIMHLEGMHNILQSHALDDLHRTATLSKFHTPSHGDYGPAMLCGALVRVYWQVSILYISHVLGV